MAATWAGPGLLYLYTKNAYLENINSPKKQHEVTVNHPSQQHKKNTNRTENFINW